MLGEVELWRAVIERGFLDYKQYKNSKSESGQAIFKDADAWLGSDNFWDMVDLAQLNREQVSEFLALFKRGLYDKDTGSLFVSSRSNFVRYATRSASTERTR